jgi:hypothetical protein
MHNPNATRTNIMGGSVTGMHTTILPSTSGCTPPNHCTQQQQHPQQCPPNAYYPPGCWLGNNRPLPHSMAECHRPMAPTARKRSCHAGVSIRPRNDDECRTALAGHRKFSNDANGPAANGGTRVNEPLCPKPASQPNARVFLMGRGR